MRPQPMPLSLQPMQCVYSWPSLTPRSPQSGNALAQRDLNWGRHYYRQGQLDKALPRFEAALYAYRQMASTVGMGQSLNGLSAVYLRQENYGRSLAYSQAAAAILEDAQAPSDYALALYQLGLSHWRLEQLSQAERCFDQALALYHRLGERTYENRVLLSLGQLYAQQGKCLFALACYESVLDHLFDNPTQDNLQDLLDAVLRAMLQLCTQTKSGTAAIASYQTLLQHRIPADYHQQIAHLIQQLGQFHELQQHYRLALECYAQALQTIPPVELA
ncbi:MAG TPA: tetratricopeptide repeat protein [Candidatus Obscuribacterales bacterium]